MAEPEKKRIEFFFGDKPQIVKNLNPKVLLQTFREECLEINSPRRSQLSKKTPKANLNFRGSVESRKRAVA